MGVTEGEVFAVRLAGSVGSVLLFTAGVFSAGFNLFQRRLHCDQIVQ